MSKTTGRIILMPGDKLKYKTNLYDTWKTVQVISNAGKSTGQYKNAYNVKHNDNIYF